MSRGDYLLLMTGVNFLDIHVPTLGVFLGMIIRELDIAGNINILKENVCKL